MEKESLKQTTESERILGSFDNKLEVLDELSSQITKQVTNAVGFDLRKSNHDESKDCPQGGNFICELDNRLAKLQKLIEQFDEIQYNLSRLV